MGKVPAMINQRLLCRFEDDGLLGFSSSKTRAPQKVDHSASTGNWPHKEVWSSGPFAGCPV